MNNWVKIIIGILIFLGLFTFPIWYTMGKAGAPPKLELPAKEKKCVAATDYMKASHMDLLDSWRNSVVRDGDRIYVGLDDKKFNMSLQNTCMKCHTSKAKFCDKCHNYLDVAPRCWNCHIEPKEKAPEGSK